MYVLRSQITGGGRYCPNCATPVPADASADSSNLAILDVPPVEPARVSHPRQARFVPGTMLAQRFRVVAQIGEEGLGKCTVPTICASAKR